MMDTYVLEEAVYLFDEYVKTASPPADIKFDYGFRRPHCWRGENTRDAATRPDGVCCCAPPCGTALASARHFWYTDLIRTQRESRTIE